jgi:hypothetical protein
MAGSKILSGFLSPYEFDDVSRFMFKKLITLELHFIKTTLPTQANLYPEIDISN